MRRPQVSLALLSDQPLCGEGPSGRCPIKLSANHSMICGIMGRSGHLHVFGSGLARSPSCRSVRLCVGLLAGRSRPKIKPYQGQSSSYDALRMRGMGGLKKPSIGCLAVSKSFCDMEGMQAHAMAQAILEPDPSRLDVAQQERAIEAAYLSRKRNVAWCALAGSEICIVVAHLGGTDDSFGVIWGGLAGSAMGWFVTRRPRPWLFIQCETAVHHRLIQGLSFHATTNRRKQREMP